jgi:UDP-glucose 4-epimerase
LKTIANIVVEEMGLKDVKLIFRSGTADGRGWIGDIKNMQLDISKIKKLGWEPKLNSEQAIRETVNTIIKC